MGRNRSDRSRKKKDNVRFIVTKPVSRGRLKLSDRLFHPERTSTARSLRPKVEPIVSPLQGYLPNLSFPTRVMSILIAAVCIGASLAVIFLGVRDRKCLLALPGPFGIWYGIAWVRVAHEGYLPGGRLRLNPWGRE
jgi:hypothetical protein